MSDAIKLIIFELKDVRKKLKMVINLHAIF